MPEIGWFSSTREESTGRGVLCPKALVSLTWPYAAAVRGGQVRVARSARREPPRGLTLMKTSRFLAGLPCFSATKARGGRLRGRARISEPTAPRRRKRAVDQAIESSHHTQSERHIGSHRPASLSTRQTMVL